MTTTTNMATAGDNVPAQFKVVDEAVKYMLTGEPTILLTTTLSCHI